MSDDRPLYSETPPYIAALFPELQEQAEQMMQNVYDKVMAASPDTDLDALKNEALSMMASTIAKCMMSFTAMIAEQKNAPVDIATEIAVEETLLRFRIGVRNAINNVMVANDG